MIFVFLFLSRQEIVDTYEKKRVERIKATKELADAEAQQKPSSKEKLGTEKSQKPAASSMLKESQPRSNASPIPSGPQTSNAQSEELIRTQNRAIHDELSNELYQHTLALKRQNELLRDAIREERANVQAVHVTLGENWGKFKEGLGGVVALGKRSWGTTIRMWIVLVLSVVVFCIAYVIMNLFSKTTGR
jgi:hypothetical protein